LLTWLQKGSSAGNPRMMPQDFQLGLQAKTLPNKSSGEPPLQPKTAQSFDIIFWPLSERERRTPSWRDRSLTRRFTSQRRADGAMVATNRQSQPRIFPATPYLTARRPHQRGISFTGWHTTCLGWWSGHRPTSAMAWAPLLLPGRLLLTGRGLSEGVAKQWEGKYQVQV